ncbi:hypothetical protein Q8A67_013376 [Cirrhinus molitorella]|uniref:Uncharacterized protein n=1 Tax=Cirrhinus molitorella TaxID=172907 RepID=A0AA88PL43_9TELE|nr:hypothetical protein Q8A67_013376 [Cirrhinus molitorella]
MAELNPVSDTHSLLESMLQRLRLNAQTNNSSPAHMQTCSPPGESNTGPVDSSKTTVYQFGISSNSKPQDGQASVWNKWENSWTQQSKDVLTPAAKQPVRRITKHSLGFSGKPKRPPLIWGEQKHFTLERTGDATSWVEDDQMPRTEKKEQFSLEGETSLKAVSPSLYKTESFPNPPDLLAPTLTTSSTVLEKPEVKGQSGTWRWRAETERNESTRFHEPSAKMTNRRMWGAKKWAQNVKEKWREKNKSTLTRQSDDGESQAQNEVQSNHSSLSVPIEVNETPTALTETTNISQEEIRTALDEDGPGSLSYMSDSLLSFGTTSNLMEEIFSGTQWAQFLSVNSNKPDQSNEPPNTFNQTRDEELHRKWTHTDTTESHFGSMQPSLPKSFAQDMASDKQTKTSQMSDTNTSDQFANQSQYRNPYESYSSKGSNEQPQFSQLDPNESKANEHSDQKLMSSQVSSPRHNQPQGGTEDFIPLLDLSYARPIKKKLSVTSQGSLSRKREHWTNRRESFEPTTQDMEDEEYGGSFRPAESSNPVCSPSPGSSLDSISEGSETEDQETAVKKMRMEDTRRVRFCEEVTILPPSYLPESDEDDDDEENENENEDENDLQEERPPRQSFPKWIVSLKNKSGKYKF